MASLSTQINDTDLKELERNFNRMWFYLLSAIYCGGGTYGCAEQKALEQMDIFVQIKTRRDNPMNEFLKEINSKNRKLVSENLAENKNSDHVFIKRVFGNELVGEHWSTSAYKEFKSALRKFNEFYNRYIPAQHNKSLQTDTHKQYLSCLAQKIRHMLVQTYAK